jgi:uncharacterized integral membrane protein (TIGR00698 family)
MDNAENNSRPLTGVKAISFGLLISTVIGLGVNALVSLSGLSIADPLVVSLIIGIICRTVMGERQTFRDGVAFAPKVLLPIGIVFYALVNLNFMRLVESDLKANLLVLVIICAIFFVVILLGTWLGQKKQITYLVGIGSAICGASAIAVTSPAVNAESDDISISLLSVTIAALFGLFILFPFIAVIMNFTGTEYSFFAGSTLQFTGFVKAAVGKTPFLNKFLSNDELATMALSFKALKYLALVIAIPLLSSLTRGKLYIPPVVVLFILSAIAGTTFYLFDKEGYTKNLIPVIEPVYTFSWSIAMAAIGLNANLTELLSNNGARALIMSFAGFFAAVTVFLIGSRILF